jgi:hypothetical protein
MANKNFDPNARYDTGPAAAGTGRFSRPVPVFATYGTGTGPDGVEAGSDIRLGFSAAGIPKNNVGPNVAGAKRSFNQT